MSHKGYSFESQTEDMFLNLTRQKKSDPIFSQNGTFNRSFRVPGSGAMVSIKGDVIGILPWFKKYFKVECKHRFEKTKRDGQLICIQKEWLDKIFEEAMKDNQIPVFTFAFKGSKVGRVWFVIRESVFKNIENYFNYVPTIFNVDSCIFESKKAKNPYFWIPKNMLFKEFNNVFYDVCGSISVWGSNYFIIPKETFEGMLVDRGNIIKTIEGENHEDK